MPPMENSSVSCGTSYPACVIAAAARSRSIGWCARSVARRPDGDGRLGYPGGVNDEAELPTVTVPRAPADDGAAREAGDTAVTQSELAGGRRRASTLVPGTRIGRYVVNAKLAQGGMGVVYRAHDPELGRDVALKLVRVRANTDTLPIARERLMREAQALAQISHPNVIAVHDVGTHGRDVFIAMELVAGQALRA